MISEEASKEDTACESSPSQIALCTQITGIYPNTVQGGSKTHL